MQLGTLRKEWATHEGVNVESHKGKPTDCLTKVKQWQDQVNGLRVRHGARALGH